MSSGKSRSRYPYPLNVLVCADEWVNGGTFKQLNDGIIEELLNDRMFHVNFEFVSHLSVFLNHEYEAVRFHYHDDKSIVAIADIMNLSVSRAAQILHAFYRKIMKPEQLSIIISGIDSYYNSIIEKTKREYEEIGYKRGLKDGFEKAMEGNTSTSIINKETVPNITIEELHLSPRLFNVLKRNKIDTLKELVNADPSDIVKLRNFGKSCAKELIDVFESYGIDPHRYKVESGLFKVDEKCTN